MSAPPPPMQPLAKVTTEPSDVRGPDVRCAVTVPRRWLHTGATIAVDPPRLASCAACDGGGCDVCHSRGALSLRDRDAIAEPLVVHLTADAHDRAQVIRLPEQGAQPWEPAHPRGCLLLEIQPGDDPSAGVSLVKTDRQPGLSDTWSPAHLMTVAVLLGLVLALIIISGK